MAQNRFGNQVAERPPEAKQPRQSEVAERQKPRQEPERQIPPDARPTSRFTWRPKVIYELLKSTYDEWSRDKAPRMGAALAYYTIFSLAPLLVIAIAISGFVFGTTAVERRFTDQIQGLVGAESAHAVHTMIQSAHKPAHGLIATIFGVVILLLGASGVFTEMQHALNTIWKVDTASKTGVWNMLKYSL